MQVEPKCLTKCSLILILNLLENNVFPLINATRRLFNVKALRRRRKKARVIHMKFEKFVIVFFQITVDNNRYGI